MTWGRCYLQTIRLVSDFSKHYVNNRGKKITLVESNISTKQAPSTYLLHSKMASTTTNLGNQTRKHKNKLAFEKSPYLLQHATNPVDWYPWGEEAFEKARREGKLIFLSVGYSTCHWCHVMEKESFENPEIAKIMNKYFVNVKVDREERPDIDKVYMTFIQSIWGPGGWPMNVFLTPDLNPITGGTYFPPVDRYGHPGFKRILQNLGTKWIEKRAEFQNSSVKILEALRRSVETKARTEGDIPTFECASTCVKQMANVFESRFGGFSHAPKFPQPVNFNVLFLMYARDPTSEIGKQCLNMCVHTLIKMANGGIHDQVGQGFARYSVDEKWHVPHFEKMLYDQGQLLLAYSEAYLATNDPFFAEITNDIVTYVVRDLRHPEGGFYSAEDADSLPTHDAKAKTEGAFYAWAYEEVESLLQKVVSDKKGTTLADIFCHHFNVRPEGNIQAHQDPHRELTGKNVLIVYGSIAETAEYFKLRIDTTKSYLQESLNILFEERKKRPRPHLDDKIITAWNGLMITGLAHAASALDNPKYAQLAEDAAKFIERHLYDKNNKVLLRSCYRGENNQIIQTSVPIKGFQSDYAFVIRGMLDLYEVNFDTHWLELAEELQDIQDKLFWDDENGGYYSTTLDDRSVILRIKDEQDTAEPSGNSAACGNLVRLASILDRSELFDRAGRLLSSMRDVLTRLPIACTDLVVALVNLIDSTTQVYIVGKKDAEDTKQMLRIVRSKLIPGKIVILADGENKDNILYRKNGVIGQMKQQNGCTTAYVCHHHVCSLPVTDTEELAQLLDRKRVESTS